MDYFHVHFFHTTLHTKGGTRYAGPFCDIKLRGLQIHLKKVIFIFY